MTETYEFNGYYLTEDEFQSALFAATELAEIGVGEEVVNDFEHTGVMISDPIENAIVIPDADLGEMLAMVIKDTGDIPFHIVKRPLDVDDEFYILCIACGDNSNFGGDVPADEIETAKAIREDRAVCAVVTTGDEIPRATRTSLVYVDSDEGLAIVRGA